MRPVNWYILRTAFKAEKIVKKRLLDQGTEIYLPLYSSKRKWSDRTTILELPLFSQYIFVHCNDFRLRTLSLIPGVICVVKFNEKPATLHPSDIEMIKEFCQMAQQNEIITEAEAIKEVGGYIEKQSGKITLMGNKLAYLYFEPFNSATFIKFILEKNITL